MLRVWPLFIVKIHLIGQFLAVCAQYTLSVHLNYFISIVTIGSL